MHNPDQPETIFWEQLSLVLLHILSISATFVTFGVGGESFLRSRIGAGTYDYLHAFSAKP
jgi:hypothetical protein